MLLRENYGNKHNRFMKNEKLGKGIYGLLKVPLINQVSFLFDYSF